MMVASARQLEAKNGRAAMSRSRLCPEPRPAPPALLSENSRRGNFFPDARQRQLEDHLSRGGLLGSDGASLGWTVDAFVDPIGYLAGDANLYRYVGNCPTTATDPLGLADGMEGVAQQARYQYALQAWRQCMLNYYHDVMNEMVAVGNIVNDSGVGGLAARDPAYSNFKPDAKDCNVCLDPGKNGSLAAQNAAGKQFGWPTHWSRLLDAINYSLTNYNDGRYWNYVQGSSMNMPFVPGITMDAQPFDSGNLYTTIMLLIHEPLHDFWQFGLGHGGWGSYGLGDVVGPTNSPPEGSYYDQFYDFLQNARCDSTSLWDAMKKKVGDCKCGAQPKWGDYVK